MKKIAGGFTLVEILVVIAIVAIVGTILVTIFANTLRGSTKSQILAVIKQNGQAVLDDIDKTVRGADSLLCDPGSSKTTVVEKNGVYTRYRILLQDDTVGPSSCIGTGKNGCVIEDHPTRQRDETGVLETESAFKTTVCTDLDPMPRAGLQVDILTDTSEQSGVSVEDGSFNVSKPSGYKAELSLNLKLKAGAGVPPSVADQIDPVVFQTTVQLR